METATNLKSLFVAILLIVAGLISPSNGVDDRTYKTPLEMLTVILVVVFAAVTIYVVWNLIEKYKEYPKQNYNVEKENS